MLHDTQLLDPLATALCWHKTLSVSVHNFLCAADESSPPLTTGLLQFRNNFAMSKQVGCRQAGQE